MRDRDWTLTYDHLGKAPMQVAHEKQTVPFRLYDDDGILYFSGMMTFKLYDSHHIFDPLDYAEGNWGCTELQVENPKNKIWETI
jgi:hypothetical protein